MKTKRSLSGIYFRYQNPENNKWENWCFEDLPEEEQNKIIDVNTIEWLKSMIKILSNRLNDIGNQLDLTTEI
jgi:hypothetical protein